MKNKLYRSLFFLSTTVGMHAKHTIFFDHKSTAFLVNVTIMDLDSKPISHATKYVKQLQQSRLAFEKYKQSTLKF